jgi:hypothetical protein
VAGAVRAAALAWPATDSGYLFRMERRRLYWQHAGATYTTTIGESC